ncbi:hypothetical protein GCM10023080_057440 [Streptomyces pseudoechinosporeus]
MVERGGAARTRTALTVAPSQTGARRQNGTPARAAAGLPAAPTNDWKIWDSPCGCDQALSKSLVSQTFPSHLGADETEGVLAGAGPREEVYPAADVTHRGYL